MKPTSVADGSLGQAIKNWPLLDDLAKRSGVRREEVQRVLAALASLAAERLAGHRGSFVLPGLCKARTLTVQPRPDRPGRNPFTGEAMTLRGRLGSHRIYLVLDPVLKALERKDIRWESEDTRREGV